MDADTPPTADQPAGPTYSIARSSKSVALFIGKKTMNGSHWFHVALALPVPT